MSRKPRSASSEPHSRSSTGSLLAWLVLGLLGLASSMPAAAQDLSKPPEGEEALRGQIEASWKLLTRHKTEPGTSKSDAAEAAEAALEQLDQLWPQHGPLPGFGLAGYLGLRGDLLLAAGRWRQAANAYRAAADAGEPFETLRGMLYESKLYFSETYSTERWGSGRTQFLLAADPESGRVLERHFLPYPPRRFRLGEDRLWLARDLDPEVRGGVRWLSIVQDRLDRPPRLGWNVESRSESLRPGFALAVNYFYDGEALHSTFTLSSQPDADAPTTLARLEVELQQASVRDPTQPWHLFLLGQVYWAQQRFDDAVREWRRLFAQPFEGTPYFSYAWMAAAFERYRQPEWADRAYLEALERRRELPRPIDFDREYLRGAILPFTSLEALAGQRPDPERAYLWWLRTRQIAGLGAHDELRAALWASHFERAGSPEKAREAREYGRSVRELAPMRHSQIVGADYAGWLLAATALGFWALFWSVFWRGIFGPDARERHGSPETLPPTAADRGLPARWRDAWAFGRRRIRRFFRNLSRRDGVALGFAAFVLTCGVWVWILILNAWIFYAFYSSLSPDETFLFELSGDAESSLFAQAVGLHVAGDLERARELYLAAGDSSTVARYRLALEEHRLPPSGGWTAEILRLVRQGYGDTWEVTTLTKVEWWLEVWLDSAQGVLHWLGMLTLLCAAAGLSQGHREWRTSAKLHHLARILARGLLLLFPGLFDLCRSRHLRGCAVLTLWLFATSFAQWWISTGAIVGPGPISASSTSLDAWRQDSLIPEAPESWDLLLLWPGVELFLGAVAMALLIALAAHAARIPEIWRWTSAEESS